MPKKVLDELVKKIKAAKSDKEKKVIIGEHKEELTDAELEQISGGTIITEGRACW